MNTFCTSYLNILKNDYSGLNLTRLDSYEDFYSKQYLDSITPALEIEGYKSSLLAASIIVDVGFGGGVPILPLASLENFHDKKFIGIESIGKKVNAVSDIARKMGLNNCKFICTRLEDVLIDVPNVVVISKAVAPIEKFVSYLRFSKELTVYFYKGPKLKEELFEFEKKYSNQLDWKIVEDSKYALPSGEIRFLFGMKFSVPHRTSKNTKLKLSEMFNEA